MNLYPCGYSSVSSASPTESLCSMVWCSAVWPYCMQNREKKILGRQRECNRNGYPLFAISMIHTARTTKTCTKNTRSKKDHAAKTHTAKTYTENRRIDLREKNSGREGGREGMTEGLGVERRAEEEDEKGRGRRREETRPSCLDAQSDVFDRV